MRVRLGLAMVVSSAMLALTGCGGDHLELCDGCGTPTPTVTETPTATVTSTPTTPVAGRRTSTPVATPATANTP